MAKTANTTDDNSHLVGILAYITIIGWIVALVLHMQKKTDFGGFHIRQTLLLYIGIVVLGWIPIIGWIVALLLWVLWLIGLIGAAQGKKNLIPILGPWAQDWFKWI